MFKWAYEYAEEVNVPLSKVWEFSVDPTEWPKWIKQYESCEFTGQIQAGSKIKAKIKGRNQHLSILVTDLNSSRNQCTDQNALFYSSKLTNNGRDFSRQNTHNCRAFWSLFSNTFS